MRDFRCFACMSAAQPAIGWNLEAALEFGSGLWPCPNKRVMSHMQTVHMMTMMLRMMMMILDGISRFASAFPSFPSRLYSCVGGHIRFQVMSCACLLIYLLTYSLTDLLTYATHLQRWTLGTISKGIPNASD